MIPARQFSYNIRKPENILQAPKPRTDYLKQSFRYSGAVLRNRFPSELRKPLPLTSFRKGTNDLYLSTGTYKAKVQSSILCFYCTLC